MAFTPYQLAQGMQSVISQPITVARGDGKGSVNSYTFILICCGVAHKSLWVEGVWCGGGRKERVV